jgi:zinc protease
MKASRGFDLRPLKVPSASRWVLSNGLKVHVVRRPQLPLVAVRLMVRSGSAVDPSNQRGLADFTAGLLRRGAAGKSADVINESIEFVGGSLSGWASEDALGVAVQGPSAHIESLLAVMGEVVMLPEFPEEEIALAKRRTLAQIANDLDDPGAVADRALTRALWGSHPYGHETMGAAADIKKFSRGDLVRFHRLSMGPQVSDLIIIGDVQPDEMYRLVEVSFGGWKGGPSASPVLPPTTGLTRAGEVVLVDKPEQTQVQVRIGAKGVPRGHPEAFPIAVMSVALGGGFTSRLVSEIRVKRGLSYGAGCHFDSLAAGGAFSVSSFTKTETCNDLLTVALDEVAKMRQKGPTPKEVKSVQRYISGLYPARLETNESLASAIADIQLYKLPEDWVEKYRERLCAVSVKQAAAAAKSYLFSNERVVVLVGSAQKLEKKVARFGRVTVIKPNELE